MRSVKIEKGIVCGSELLWAKVRIYIHGVGNVVVCAGVVERRPVQFGKDSYSRGAVG